MVKQKIAKVDLTMTLHGNKVADEGHLYHGVIKLDGQGATFVEATRKQATNTRAPRVYDGEHVTVTCACNGKYRVNLKTFDISEERSDIAWAVYSEINEAISSIFPEVKDE